MMTSQYAKCTEIVRQVAAEMVAGGHWRLTVGQVPHQASLIVVTLDNEDPETIERSRWDRATKFATAQTAFDMREILAWEKNSEKLIANVRARIGKAIAKPAMVGMFEISPPLTIEPGDGEIE